MKNLSFVKFDRNFITEVPSEFTCCENIFQMSFVGCARLFVIPRNLLMMPKLISADFRGCSLFTIPSMVTPTLQNLLLHGNQFLNSIPYEVMSILEKDITTSEFYAVDEEDVTKVLIDQ